MKVLVVFGTRPEAIKLWPVIKRLRSDGIDVIICNSGQHRDLLANILPTLGILPDFNLDLMVEGQSPEILVARVSASVTALISRLRPDWVIVQGDTSTALGAALAARRSQKRLAHVEAGLRTFDRAAPWPEEDNRCAIAKLADIHFAPTSLAASNLEAEGIPVGSIQVTGNTAIDALHAMLHRLDTEPKLRSAALAEIGPLAAGRRLIIVTAHRRENFDNLAALTANLRGLAGRGDVEIVLPVHPNPAGRLIVDQLKDSPCIRLLRALSYQSCVSLLQRATLLITDSGGLQEEAPSLGLPVLVTRVSTERPEALNCGAAKIVPPENLCTVANQLLDDAVAYEAMAQVRSPFGDGRAAEQIVRCLKGAEAVAVENEACLA